jgi:hypothetical protein
MFPTAGFSGRMIISGLGLPKPDAVRSQGSFWRAKEVTFRRMTGTMMRIVEGMRQASQRGREAA